MSVSMKQTSDLCPLMNGQSDKGTSYEGWVNGWEDETVIA